MAATYFRFPPPADLSAYVEHLWMVESPAFAQPRRDILIPNGRPTVVLSLRQPGVRHDPLTETSHPNGNVVFGITTRPYVLEQSGASSYVGAQLTPWGLSALLPGRRMVDEFLPLVTWLGGPATAQLAAGLAGLALGPARAEHLAAFLRPRLASIEPATLALLRAMVAAAEEAPGLLSVAELSAALRISYSSLYRLCSERLGVAPKRFCEIVRYYAFVGDLLGDSTMDSAVLLAGLRGYYDQAHAARTFKRFTGVSATSFKQIENGIARLMHSGA